MNPHNENIAFSGVSTLIHQALMMRLLYNWHQFPTLKGDAFTESVGLLCLWNVNSTETEHALGVEKL